ncbi:MAG: hypothetical protein H7281_15125 [Bacteriovorax sp.]|nr:hypothetical protein [Bacteriovorax sp.]
MKNLLKGTVLFALVSTRAIGSAFGIPDSDTALLMSLVSNTASQITRLEQLITETDKHTKLFRDTVETVEEKYEVVEQLESLADNYVRLSNSKPEDLSEINDAIENLKDQKSRLKDLIAQARNARDESDRVKGDAIIVDKKVRTDDSTAKRQIIKSFSAGKGFSKNMERVNAQNTSLILKETVSLNGAINTSNGLQATQNNLTKFQVDQIINDVNSKNNALSKVKKGKKK